VLAALGLYHAAPGSQVWQLSGPAFPNAVIAKKLTIRASRASRLNRYIQSATLDGKPFGSPFLSSEQVHRGGRLNFEMGARPNKSWGT
jgi:putative alpha-1,2-mannosidase